MRVENQTSNPVEYEQTGGGTETEFSPQRTIQAQKGCLDPNGGHDDFAPVGKVPYRVRFSEPCDVPKPAKTASVEDINDGNVTVTLNGFPVISGS
jgi:hypothetical protein